MRHATVGRILGLLVFIAFVLAGCAGQDVADGVDQSMVDFDLLLTVPRQRIDYDTAVSAGRLALFHRRAHEGAGCGLVSGQGIARGASARRNIGSERIPQSLIQSRRQVRPGFRGSARCTVQSV